jgi:hypothetical protein
MGINQQTVTRPIISQIFILTRWNKALLVKLTLAQLTTNFLSTFCCCRRHKFAIKLFLCKTQYFYNADS